MHTDIVNLYPTPVMFGSINDYDLSAVTQELLTNVDFASGGNVNGMNLLENSELTEFQTFFKQNVVSAFDSYMQQVYNQALKTSEYEFQAWCVNGAGKYSLDFHNHKGSQLSAVFYILVENSVEYGGKFKFYDPRFNANRGMTEPFLSQHKDFEFLPKTGDFLIFPSYLYHSVSIFHGNLRLIVPVDMFRIT